MEEGISQPTAAKAPVVQPGSTPQSFPRRDILEILGKSGKYKYRWLVYEKIRQMGGLPNYGWRILTSLSKTDEILLKEHGIESVQFLDGCLRKYEMVAAFMPMDMFRERQREKDAARLADRNALRKRNVNSKEIEEEFSEMRIRR